MSKVALISGATGGIGSAIAYKLAKEGYSLQLHYHVNQTKAIFLQEELSKRYHAQVSIYQANLSKSGEADRLVRCLDVCPDIIIHNAGTSQYGLFTEIRSEEYQKMLQLHITSPFILTQQLVPSMIRNKWGRIIFISSIWGETGAACETLYSMVKGAQLALTKSLAKELALSGITVNAVSPGAIETKMMASFTEEEINQLLDEIPIGRLGTPEQVAHAVHYLVEEESAYTTGQTIRINGGWFT